MSGLCTPGHLCLFCLKPFQTSPAGSRERGSQSGSKPQGGAPWEVAVPWGWISLCRLLPGFCTSKPLQSCPGRRGGVRGKHRLGSQAI